MTLKIWLSCFAVLVLIDKPSCLVVLPFIYCCVSPVLWRFAIPASMYVCMYVCMYVLLWAHWIIGDVWCVAIRWLRLLLFVWFAVHTSLHQDRNRDIFALIGNNRKKQRRKVKGDPVITVSCNRSTENILQQSKESETVEVAFEVKKKYDLKEDDYFCIENEKRSIRRVKSNDSLLLSKSRELLDDYASSGDATTSDDCRTESCSSFVVESELWRMIINWTETDARWQIRCQCFYFNFIFFTGVKWYSNTVIWNTLLNCTTSYSVSQTFVRVPHTS